MTGNAKFGSRLLKTNSISRHCKYFARVSPLKGFLLVDEAYLACCEDPHSHTITRHRRCHKLDAYLIWIGVSGWRLLAENQLSGNFYHLGVFPPPAPVPAPTSNSIWFTNFLSRIPVRIFADKRKRYVHIVLPKNTWRLWAWDWDWDWDRDWNFKGTLWVFSLGFGFVFLFLFLFAALAWLTFIWLCEFIKSIYDCSANKLST